MSELERVSVTIEKELLQKFDTLLEQLQLGNRSEAVRDLIRARLVDETWKDDKREVVATVTLVYDHEKRGLADQLVAAAHEHHAIALATLHVHLDSRHCLEVTALRGKPREVRHLAERLIGTKGVLHGKIASSALPR